jgi:hypothetical protein
MEDDDASLVGDKLPPSVPESLLPVGFPVEFLKKVFSMVRTLIYWFVLADGFYLFHARALCQDASCVLLKIILDS